VRFALLAFAALLACDTPTPPAAAGVELIEAPAGTSDIAALVRATAQQLGVRHRRLVVYVGATWCEPCQQIHAAIAGHRLDTVFPDLSLLVFDADRDATALEKAGYVSDLIPLFALPDADGRSSARREFGGRKDIDNVPLLTDKLHRLLD